MTLLLGTLELKGANVSLLPMQPEHTDALASAASESRDTYAYGFVPEGREEMNAYIEEALLQRSTGQRYAFVIAWRGKIVGSTSYYEFQPWQWPPKAGRPRRDCPDSTSIGYTWLSASAQRTACNTEAKYLLFTHAFEAWKVHSVGLRADARNLRSRRAIERLGCVFEGIRRAHMPAADGTVRDSACYSMIAGEWSAAKERFRQLMRRSTP